jgi:hypothetical protein
MVRRTVRASIFGNGAAIIVLFVDHGRHSRSPADSFRDDNMAEILDIKIRRWSQSTIILAEAGE